MNALIGICLDESDSMSNEVTVKAFNAFLRLQQYRMDDCSLFLVKFGSYYEPTVEFQSIFTVPEMSLPGSGSIQSSKRRSFGRYYATDLHYCSSGGTMLFDSIAYTITEMEAHINGLPDDQKPQRVTLVVQTDGGNTMS